MHLFGHQTKGLGKKHLSPYWLGFRRQQLIEVLALEIAIAMMPVKSEEDCPFLPYIQQKILIPPNFVLGADCCTQGWHVL